MYVLITVSQAARVSTEAPTARAVADPPLPRPSRKERRDAMNAKLKDSIESAGDANDEMIYENENVYDIIADPDISHIEATITRI